jgi:predicted O-methyltransferase YrrM
MAAPATAGLDRTITKYVELDAETRSRVQRRSSPLDDLAYLAMVLRANEVVDMIEIGTFLGQSACFLAPAIRGKFYTINKNPREVAIAKETLEKFEITNVVCITGDSLVELPKLVKKVERNLNAVYIDGFHSYEYAYGEYQIVEPYLRDKASAAIFFDDAHKLHPDGATDGGVPRAVREANADAIPILGHRVAIKTYGSFKYL